MYSPKTLKYFNNPKNYGKIKNPDGVGKVGNIVCVLPTTRILVNGEVKDIQEVKKGDLVLSHDGQYQIVNNVFRRKVAEKILVIKNKMGVNYVTSDHLIFGAKIPKTWYFSFTKRKKRFTQNLAWYHASDLEKRDLIAYPIFNKIKDIKRMPINFPKSRWDFKSKTLPKSVKINSNFLRLIGYYLAEGYAQDEVSKTRVGFVFNSKEIEYIEDVRLIVKKLFNLEAKISANKHNSTNIYFNSVVLVKLFKQLAGKGAAHKCVADFIMALPLNKQAELIVGLWRGDGYFNTTRAWPRAGYTTVSLRLAQQLKMLLLRQGIIASVYEEKAKEINGVKHQQSYRLHVGERGSLLKLAQILKTPLKITKEIRIRTWTENGYVFLPITDIKKINYRGEVYNLEVAKTRSFTSDAFCLHNCGDVMWLYIKVGKNKKKEEIIKDIKYETFGCVAAIATSGQVTELAKGKTISQALAISKDAIVKELGGLPPVKLHCSVLAVDALAEAIYDYLNKNKRPIPESLTKQHQIIQKHRGIIEEKYHDWVEKEEEMLKND